MKLVQLLVLWQFLMFWSFISSPKPKQDDLVHFFLILGTFDTVLPLPNQWSDLKKIGLKAMERVEELKVGWFLHIFDVPMVVGPHNLVVSNWPKRAGRTRDFASLNGLPAGAGTLQSPLQLCQVPVGCWSPAVASGHTGLQGEEVENGTYESYTMLKWRYTTKLLGKW